METVRENSVMLNTCLTFHCPEQLELLSAEFHMYVWVLSGFYGFLPPPKNMLVGGLVTLNCFNVCVCVHNAPAMDKCPIQGVFQPRTRYSRDRLRIHLNPDQDKTVTEDK